MARVRLISSGKIWTQRTAREILWTILKIRNVETGVLRISCPTKHLEGDILVSRCMFVAGAQLRSGVSSGYPAIQMLLSIHDGSYQFLDYGEGEVAELDQQLKIRLTSLINRLPDLPSDPALLTGPNTLNKIRAMNEAGKHTEESLIRNDTLAHLAQWEQRSFGLRGFAFWAGFLVVSSMAALMYYFHN